MTGSASATVRLKLEQAMGQWRQWQTKPPLPGAPHLLGPLAGGGSNDSFLVGAAERRYVLRVDRVNPASNGISRLVEWRALMSASALGIAPRPCYFNPELGVLVCDYLETEPANTTDPAALATLLRAIHGLPAVHFRMDPGERIRRYEHQLAGDWAGLQSLSPRLLSAIDALGPVTPALCHHDLSRDNLLLCAGRLVALDWEYAAMGNPWFDIAHVVSDQDLSTDDTNRLLQAYLDRQPSAIERRHLQLQGLVAHLLELLWHASGQGRESERFPVAQKAAELERQLDASLENY